MQPQFIAIMAFISLFMHAVLTVMYMNKNVHTEEAY